VLRLLVQGSVVAEVVDSHDGGGERRQSPL
jgi:hypothetical protein